MIQFDIFTVMKPLDKEASYKKTAKAVKHHRGYSKLLMGKA
jgi:hypothetical protein